MTYCRKVFIASILCLLIGSVSAQVKKGDAFFNNLDYHKAIQCYQKALKKKKYANNPELLIHVADAFRFIKDYSNASNYYKLGIQAGSVNPDAFLHYGMILKSQGQYDEAEAQFRKCLEKKPGDVLATNGIRSCQDVKKWKTKPKEYEVKNIEKLNTDKSEFSPVVWKNNLVFVAERVDDLINFSQYDYNGKPYLNVYLSELKNGEPGKEQGFSRKLNSNYHDGPVCFTKDGNTIYFTRVKYVGLKKKTGFVNRAKIFSAELSGTNLKKQMDFQYDSDDYSIAHPNISEDGQLLFFASDKPGGFGGMDIYVCKKNASGWDAPVNLGPDINTSGAEEFPFLRSDGILFYSSNGLPGFGGMDIFSAYQVSGKWIMRRNEGMGINDVTDDFGIFFTNKKEGYFSSDRAGGKGSDDIYSFTFTEKSVVLDGFILTALDTARPAGDQKIILVEPDGHKVAEGRTNSKGYFKFENLEAEKKYMVKMDETDPGFSDYPRYYYSDDKGNIMRVTKKDDKQGKFIFQGLPLAENASPELENKEDITIAGNVLFGDNATAPVTNAKMILKDEKGHVIDETTTNAFGSFAFRNLPSDRNYIIEMEAVDTDIPEGTRIVITNKDGKEMKVLKNHPKNKFTFSMLSSDKNFVSEMNAEDKDLVMDLSGIAMDPQKKAIAGSKVQLFDDKGNKIAETVTGKDGSFTFKNLAATKNYLISMDADDPGIAGIDKILIADKKGRVIKELKRKNNFKYQLLSSDKQVLTEMYVDDPWLEVLELQHQAENKDSLTIVESVYYASGDWKFDASGQKVLDKVIKIMKDNPNITIELSSHTDSKADDVFNLKLSEKRARSAVDYIIKNGINKKRITAVGLGEKKLINECGNGVECPDEKHAQNRRTEFKILQKKI
jgi:outer membrane protein OmpA-like peptidoglycan-associated protein/tetratricopeptide (TPR) repeat protein